MRLDNLKVGMKIRICKDPSVSIIKFKGKIAKLRMAGKVKTIRSILPLRNAISVKDRGRKWTIHIDDLREIKSLPPIESAIFDPDQLVIE